MPYTTGMPIITAQVAKAAIIPNLTIAKVMAMQIIMSSAMPNGLFSFSTINNRLSFSLSEGLLRAAGMVYPLAIYKNNSLKKKTNVVAAARHNAMIRVIFSVRSFLRCRSASDILRGSVLISSSFRLHCSGCRA